MISQSQQQFIIHSAGSAVLSDACSEYTLKTAGGRAISGKHSERHFAAPASENLSRLLCALFTFGAGRDILGNVQPLTINH